MSMPRRLVCILLACVAVAFACAIQIGDDVVNVTTCDTCIADPIPRCAVPTSCGFCPIGAGCTLTQDQCAEGGTTSVYRCAASLNENPGSLSANLRLDQFELQRVARDAGPAAFTWASIPGANIVRCALFACPPSMLVDSTQDPPDIQITNYSECVWQDELFPSGQGIFDLGVSNRVGPFSTISSRGCTTLGNNRMPVSLSVGCLAYDTTQVIAVTPLVPVGATEVSSPFVDSTCSSGNGKACPLLGTNRWGICHQGTCAQRCIDDFDCRFQLGLPTDAGRVTPIPLGADASILCVQRGRCSDIEFDGGFGVCDFPDVSSPVVDAGADVIGDGGGE
jgi:hypothetical protein